jgi:hypothetical protein
MDEPVVARLDLETDLATELEVVPLASGNIADVDREACSCRMEGVVMANWGHGLVIVLELENEPLKHEAHRLALVFVPQLTLPIFETMEDQKLRISLVPWES